MRFASPLGTASAAERVERALEERQHRRDAARADHAIPERLELLPAARVEQVAHPRAGRLLAARAAHDRGPAVELAVGVPVAVYELARGHAPRPVDDVPRVVEIPVRLDDPALRLHPR